MRKHCGNCANHRKETNKFSEDCGKCVAAILSNGEKTDPSNWREKPQTNADRIRAMSDEELACYLALVENRKSGGIVFEDTSDKWLKWLKQPAKE